MIFYFFSCTRIKNQPTPLHILTKPTRSHEPIFTGSSEAGVKTLQWIQTCRGGLCRLPVCLSRRRFRMKYVIFSSTGTVFIDITHNVQLEDCAQQLSKVLFIYTDTEHDVHHRLYCSSSLWISVISAFGENSVGFRIGLFIPTREQKLEGWNTKNDQWRHLCSLFCRSAVCCCHGWIRKQAQWSQSL